jgi:hypothetical protein
MAGASSTSKWRPFVELAAAFIFLSVPSGLVPGTGEDGRGLSSQFSGGARGPDCFFKFCLRVFSVRNMGWFMIVLFFRIPVVNCTYSAASPGSKKKLMLTDINSCMPYRFLNFCAH